MTKGFVILLAFQALGLLFAIFWHQYAAIVPWAGFLFATSVWGRYQKRYGRL